MHLPNPSTPGIRKSKYMSSKSSSKRLLFISAALCLCATLASALITSKPIASLLTLIAVASGMLAVRTSILRPLRANHLALKETLKAINREQLNTNARVKKTPDIAGTVGGIRRELGELHRQLETPNQPSPPNPDIPESIHCSSPILEAIEPGRSPRRGGRITGAPTPGTTLAQLHEILETTAASQLSIAAIIPSRAPSNDHQFNWHAIEPYLGSRQMNQLDPSLLVIESGAFIHGKWIGAMDAVEARKYLHLREVIEGARKTNIPVVLFDEGLPASTFTQDLRSLVDIHVKNGDYSIGHDAMNNIHAINRIAQILGSNSEGDSDS